MILNIPKKGNLTLSKLDDKFIKKEFKPTKKYSYNLHGKTNITTPKVSNNFGKNNDKNMEKTTPKIINLFSISTTIGSDTNRQINEDKISCFTLEYVPINSFINIKEKLIK